MNDSSSYNNNSFDGIRYYSAFAVMLLHYTGYYAIYSEEGSLFLSGLRKVSLCFPGVVVLFAISGFLNAISFEHSNSIKMYLKKRAIRLFPELWLCTVFNLLVLCVLTFESLDHSIVLWCISQLIGIAYTPSCVKEFATGSINGALWTIFVELQLYIVTAFFYPRLKKLSYLKWGIGLLLLMGINLLTGYLSPLFPNVLQKLVERTFLPYALWYFIGMFCYMKRSRLLPILKRMCPILAGLYIVIYCLVEGQPGYYCGIVTSICCPFIAVGMAYRIPAFRVRKDLSYGMFLYHWIVLNILVHFQLINRLPWPVTLSLFIGITLLLAWGSRKLVSKYI